MSKVPVAWLTLPDPRNSSALKNAWGEEMEYGRAVGADA